MDYLGSVLQGSLVSLQSNCKPGLEYHLEAQVGQICLQIHSCSCCQDSVPQGLLD